MSNIDLKYDDLLEFSRMCAPEYNMPEFSDRVLVFDVMQDGWETTTLVKSGELEETHPDDSVDTSSGKRSLEEFFDVPEQKRRKKIEPNNSVELSTQLELSVPDPASESSSEIENKSDGIACEQAETQHVDKPSSLHPSIEDVHDNIDSNKIQENSDKPLRQHKIYITSLWLSIQSPYFRSLLHSSGMKETRDPEVHIKIPESEENAHLTLLKAMYRSDVLNDKNVDELLSVLELADKYDVKFVFKKCKYVLQENATTFETSTQIMHVIKVKHNMDDVGDLVATLQLVLVEEFSPLDENWKSEKFTDLSEPSVKYLLSSDDLIVQSENTVFHALMYWMKQNKVDPASLQETNDLLTSVRFKLVTIDYLYSVVKNHPIASRMPRFDELVYRKGMTYHAILSDQKKRLREKPVLRKKPEGNIIQFTFAVKEEQFKTARETQIVVRSKEFWACGYKMRVALIRQEEFGRGYCVYPYLNVDNLNKESFVPLQFAVVETVGSSIDWQEATFTLASCSKIYPDIEVEYVTPSADKTRVMYVAVKPKEVGVL